MKALRLLSCILLIALLGIVPAMAADTTVDEYRAVYYTVAPANQTVYKDWVLVQSSDEISMTIGGTPIHFPPGTDTRTVAKTPFDIYVTLERIDKYNWNYIVHNDYDYPNSIVARFLPSERITLTNGTNCGELLMSGNDTLAPLTIPANDIASIRLTIPNPPDSKGTHTFYVNRSYLNFSVTDSLIIERTVSPVISVEKSYNKTAWKALYTVNNPAEDDINADITFWYELHEDRMGTNRTELGNATVIIGSGGSWNTTHVITTGEEQVPVFYLQADAHATQLVEYTITPAYPLYTNALGDNTPPDEENTYIIGEGLVAGFPLSFNNKGGDDDDDDDDPTPTPTETQGPGPGPTDKPGPGPDETPVKIGEEGESEPFGELAELFPMIGGLSLVGGIPWWVWLLLLIFLCAFLFLILKRTTDFESDVREGPAPLTVTFTDLSTNNPSTWHWDFGDGTTSDEQHPVHTFTSPGTYTVTLTVHNRLGDHSRTRNEEITVT
jgi:hypothetical protein